MPVHPGAPRLALPAQPVDATPSSALLRHCLRGRTIMFGRTRSIPSQSSVPAGLILARDSGVCFQCQAGSSLVLRRPIEITSIKVEVKKKHFSFGWNFSCFSAHTIERELFGPTAPYARLRGILPQRFGFSLPAVFIASWQRSLFVPKPAKQNVVNFGDHSSIWDSWPIAFSDYPRGPRVA